MTNTPSLAGAAVLPDDYVYDLLRGIAAYTASPLIADLAETATAHPAAALDNAFNHKQVACKAWLRDALHLTLGPAHPRVWVLGGWYGVMAAMLLDDPRFDLGEIVSVDLDPACAPIARQLNHRAAAAGRFRTRCADMYALDYSGADAPTLVINTSCEHLPDPRAWLARLPRGLPVALQSNDYFTEPGHVSAVPDLDAFIAQAGLGEVLYAGALRLKKYTRFMLIGRR
ncbi:hypothetical protein EV699_12543 [Plasticicumulans lactativorans]|uniref:Methyltransferase family protein n=1 Tax=Plasticicumulans lactativorans TaxID=1133106 RepID=A0A4V2SC03_9GAMM|nr:class I SAM-dependent methyltransferase [Plasticicumulans lactativorans]TCO77540.1 hypothetical protein EV699_12543 [Plasticicumulans lactativorans]